MNTEQDETRFVPLEVLCTREFLLPLEDETVPMVELSTDLLIDRYFEYLDAHWFAPLRRLEPSSASSLVVLQVCFSLFEVYEQLYSGASSRGSVGAFLRAGARRVLDGQMFQTMTQAEREAFAGRFTELTRNALVHDLMPRDIEVTFDGEDEGGFSMGDDIPTGHVGVDPFWLLELIREEFQSYRVLLATDTERREIFRSTLLRIAEDKSSRTID